VGANFEPLSEGLITIAVGKSLARPHTHKRLCKFGERNALEKPLLWEKLKLKG